RSIVWIPLERRKLDLLHLLHPDLEYRGEVQPHACCLHAEVAGHGQAPYRGGRPWPGYLQGATGCG
ncbi:hypothetical protein B296_00032929, partial [Ensete ventricosum]